jgi:hypothetical protein
VIAVLMQRVAGDALVFDGKFFEFRLGAHVRVEI